MNIDELLKKQEQERTECVEKLCKSISRKKIIVSGPGTGKTYSFKLLFGRKQGNYLALTFINDLAEKLKKDLEDIAKSYTFHSFCKSLLHRIEQEDLKDNFILFPKLGMIIKSDARLIYNKDPNFSRSFKQLDYKGQNISFFLRRSNYYNAVSFDDSVFRVLKYFKEKPDEIPRYDQIVVDEYQDFNRLEVEFINVLETKSPILIVGDDDQALYTQLKYASPDYIRKKFKDRNYETFPLPFCTRCPKVIIDSLHDVVFQAKEHGKLNERIDKRYVCYFPKKLSDSKKYPKIMHTHCSVQSERTPYISKFIEQEIDKLSLTEIETINSEGDYTILITGPKQYLKQINTYLKSTKKYILHFRNPEIERKKISIIDGYKILLDDKFSNLGWRILLECDPIRNMENLLKKTLDGNDIKLYNYLPKSYIEKRKSILDILERLQNDEKITKKEERILKNIFKIKLNDLKPQITKSEDNEAIQEENIDKIKIALSTYVGCKGLSAGYVFILGLNEGNLPKKNENPADIEICQFIVALARTMKKCYLISASRFAGKPEGRHSVFIDWIDKKRIEPKKVNVEYWKSSL